MRRLAILVVVAGCAGDDAVPLAGGDATVFDRTTEAYSMPAPTLSEEELARHLAGDVAFEATFVSAPSTINPGLGPSFNNSACARCHLRDGRGMPVAGPGPLRSHLLVRVSTADGQPLAGIGSQIQDQAVFGATAEATVAIAWEEVPGRYGDGASFSLRRPVLTITPALPDGTRTSLRQPPPVFGLGLLEAVPAGAIEAMADPDDTDGDGLSGRVNHVDGVVGRFGHKANTPDLITQAAAAYRNDMGVGSSRFPDDADGGAIEVDDDRLAATAFYTATLAVPARVDVDDAEVRRGEALFGRLCAGCHVDTLVTGAHDVAALSEQTIHPYTDLLIHDLGDGLADGRPDHEASGSEWRTAPLWGIGLTHTVAAGAGFLHDGRARTLEEAILWHGGEAEAAREGFRTAEAADRAALITFLRSM